MVSGGAPERIGLYNNGARPAPEGLAGAPTRLIALTFERRKTVVGLCLL